MTITADLLDDFNRPDENPLSQGGNWRNFGTLPCQVSSNDCTGVGGNGIAVYVGISTGTVQEAWCELDTFVLGVNSSIYVGARMTLNALANRYDGYWMAWIYNGVTQQVQLRRAVNNIETVLVFLNPFNLAAGDRIGIHVDESRIEGWTYTGGVWALTLTTTDATITSGTPGIGFTTAVPRVSMFGGGLPFAPQIIRRTYT